MPQSIILARMIDGGEDPLFIARRMIILASEDVGNAAPNALTMAVASLTALQNIGMPEGRIVLAQCAVYLACRTKKQQLISGQLTVPWLRLHRKGRRFRCICEMHRPA
jgi:putative ATPase